MINYNALKKTLIDKNLKKQDLVNAGILSWATMAKLDKSKYISLAVIDKLCEYLDCGIDGIFKYIPDKELIDKKDVINSIEN